MKLLTAASAVLLLSACANKPWSEVDGSRSKGADPKNYDVFISGIDGKLYYDNMKMRTMEPGFRYLRLTSTKPDRKGRYTYNPFAMQAKPCVRYIVSAQHDSNINYDNKQWKVVVLREEPIKSCEKLMGEGPGDKLEETHKE
ncbi:hypothetical protein [Pleionea sp. CnH1-48]|uniref:hypothetical protein n=1 Tax=Pleionea sp. CnH1-48 TaxID=2954494 RepID=UPI00209738FE|nr:hypothetical protein [Pleionea sp. CnH1-48]MCO7227509.1 hypothetical protein [Pleionea sp. CnH1-48]